MNLNQLNEDLLNAVHQDDIATVTKCLSNGADIEYIDVELNFPLQLAVAGGHLNLVDLLLQSGAAIQKNIEGENCLHVAAKYNRLAIAKRLLTNGINVNAQDRELTTPLFWAVQEGNHEMTELILTTPLVNPNLTDSDGANVVELAVSVGDTEMLTLLLANKIDVNNVRADGTTPLHLAAAFEQIEIAKTLIAHGARANVYDDDNKCPLDYAKTTKNEALIELLRKT
jgi:ankyrin repeat protein